MIWPRDKVTIARLRSLEDEGALVINSAYGIDNCVRKPMTELLIKERGSSSAKFYNFYGR